MKNLTQIKTTYWAVFFLMLAIFTSVTLLSAYEILIVVPLFYFANKVKWQSKPKSWWILAALTIWALICNLINYPELIKPAKTFLKLKFFLFGLLAYFPLTALAQSEYFNSKRARFLIRTFLLTIIIACLYGTLKYKTDLFGSYTGRSKGFTQIMRYGYGSALAGTIFLVMLLVRNNISSFFIKARELYLGFFFAIIAVWASGCRGAVLGLMAGSLSALLIFKKSLIKILTPVVILVGIGGLYIITSDKIPAGSRFFLKLNHATVTIRLSQYEAALYAMKDNPITGVSLMQFSNHVTKIKKKYNLAHQEYSSHSHNIFLEMGASYGYLGFVLFILFFLFWGTEMWQLNGFKRQIYIPIIVAIFILGQFENILDANNASMIFFLYPLSFVKIPESFLSRG